MKSSVFSLQSSGATHRCVDLARAQAMTWSEVVA